MNRRIALVACAALLAVSRPMAAGGPPLRNIYVLTQAYCMAPQGTAGKCHMQELPVGATLEVQLPGTPSVWTVATMPPTLEASGTRKYPSPNRIDGTNEVFVFTFKATKAGDGMLVFKEAPAFLAKPGGTWSFPITVKEAKPVT